MVYIPPPHLANGQRPSYTEAYARILASFRASPLTSASSVLILVAPDVDALCAARMLSDLFNQDDVIHRIVPVSGFDELERIRDDLLSYSELQTLILLNMGGVLELTSETEWFGNFGSNLTVHVIDSSRPLNLTTLFLGGEVGERVVLWDDGGAEKLQEERKAWEALQYEPLPDSDDEDSDYYSDPESPHNIEGEYDEDYESSTPKKRRRMADDQSDPSKRRRVGESKRMTREQRDAYDSTIAKHYLGGTYHGQSAAGTIYVLATVLERVDNDILWLAILGLTYQYITSRISRETYESYHSIYYDEVFRLNPLPVDAMNNSSASINPDDTNIRATDELRFMLFRHWTLYDAMFHSSYLANKLGMWKERGRSRLTGLLAKMGFSIPQTQQPYSHMDMDLKRDLLKKLEEIAPEYGLLELQYPSFTRCYGYRSQPLSAADAVEGLGALLDLASGVKLEVEVEGSRNGGEWFGSGRLWEADKVREGTKEMHRSNLPADGASHKAKNPTDQDEGDKIEQETKQRLTWWAKNFWAAFDALNDVDSLREALKLAMSLHRAIIRQGTSIIDKQDIRTMRNHRVVLLSQGPDLPLFSHPGVLSRLALWLVDVLRDRIPGTSVSMQSKRKSLPFVVACLNENTDAYMVVGIMASLEFGDLRKNEFGVAFLDAKVKCNTVTRHTSFDASVLEIPQKDLKNFLEALCEGPVMD